MSTEKAAAQDPAEKPAKGTRTGFTTGACSAAAARAAVLGLLHGHVPEAVECLLPNGQLVTFAVTDGHVHTEPDSANADERCYAAHAVVIKDAGDDPDCTDKARLTVDARLLPDQPGAVVLAGGPGVGVVTMPGLGLEIGQPAINPVPRRNIEANVRAVGASLLERYGLLITISVPQGEEMAKKTTNARLGILGGISILGTTGIVLPYSTAAFRASVVQGVHVAGTLSHSTVVLTTGGRTETFAMRELPHLPPTAFVQMGDFLRYALGAAVKAQIRHVVIGGMVGKLTKIAQGETITHANRAEVNTDLLADIAASVGAPEDVCAAIRANETARFAGEQMDALGLGEAFHTALAQRVISTLRERYPDQFSLQVLVCDFDGKRIAQASDTSHTSNASTDRQNTPETP